MDGLAEQTIRGLFIIESLDRDDETLRREGVILSQIIELSGALPVKYIYIRTTIELRMALYEFRELKYRYLHFSCHGSRNSISLTLEQLSFRDLVPILAPYLKARRLFFSACSVVNSRLAKSLIVRSGCYSIIGPCRDIEFGDALLMWASFYHLAFRDEQEASLLGGKIRWALRKVKCSFGREFRYYRKVPCGWTREEIEKR
jgi:hypothetical protein